MKDRLREHGADLVGLLAVVVTAAVVDAVPGVSQVSGLLGEALRGALTVALVIAGYSVLQGLPTFQVKWHHSSGAGVNGDVLDIVHRPGESVHFFVLEFRYSVTGPVARWVAKRSLETCKNVVLEMKTHRELYLVIEGEPGLARVGDSPSSVVVEVRDTKRSAVLATPRVELCPNPGDIVDEINVELAIRPKPSGPLGSLIAWRTRSSVSSIRCSRHRG